MPFRYLLILLLLPFVSFGQGSVQPTGGVMQATYQRGGYGADSVFVVPVRDTLLNIFISPSLLRTHGRLTIRPQDNMLYFYNGNSWTKVGAGGGSTDTPTYEQVLIKNNISLNTPAIHRGSGNGLWFQNNAGTTIANVIWNESEQSVQVSTTNGTWLFRDDGSMVTYGIDEYDQNRASQYTARTKTDKNYVDSLTATIPVLDSNRFIKNDSVTKQTAGAILSAQLQARRGNFGDYDSTAMAPLKNNDRWPLTSKRYSKDVVGIESGLNVLAVYSFEDANQTASFYKSGAEFGTFVKGTNTKNFFNATHPIIRSQANNLIVQDGASGIIPECAVIYGTFANNGVGMTVQRSDLINVTYGGDSGSIEKAVGISIAGINRGKNNTGLYLAYADNDPPQAGNWALYSDYFYPSYFKGRVAIGTFLSTIQHELYVNGDVEADSAFLDNIKISTVNNALLKTVSNNVTAAVAGTDYVIPSALSAYQQYSDTNTWDATKTDVAAKLGINDTFTYWKIGGQALTGISSLGSTTETILRILNGNQTKIQINTNTNSGLIMFRQSTGVPSTGTANSEAYLSLSDSLGARKVALAVGKGLTERHGNPFLIMGVGANGFQSRLVGTVDSIVTHWQLKLVPMFSNLNGGINAQQLYAIAPNTATTMNTFYVREAGSNEIKQITPTGTPSSTTALHGDWSWKTPSGGGLSASNFVFNEVPSGTINSSNTAFTLANTPTAGTVQLFKNGQLLTPITDYTVSGSGITMVVAPLTGNVLLAHYMK